MSANYAKNCTPQEYSGSENKCYGSYNLQPSSDTQTVRLLTEISTGRDGRKLVSVLSPALLDRFWAKVRQTTPDACWEWTGHRGKYGHGQIAGPHRRPLLAHRIAWILAHGRIPSGKQINHRCHHGWCCNAAHLYVGTQLDNMRDAAEVYHLLGNRKLSDVQVVELLARYQPRVPGHTARQLAQEYGISYTHVSRALVYPSRATQNA